MIVFGRILLHKRNNSAMNSGAESVSELSTTVDAMTKLQASDPVVVTTMNDLGGSNGNESNGSIAETTNNSLVNGSLPTVDESIENTSDIDLSAPISIPSISSRNNVSFEYIF